jgi:hypothetical protein
MASPGDGLRNRRHVRGSLTQPRIITSLWVVCRWAVQIWCRIRAGEKKVLGSRGSSLSFYRHPEFRNARFDCPSHRVTSPRCHDDIRGR